MSPQLEAVLCLQSLDERAAALQKEIAALPKHVAEIERKLDAHLRRLESDRAALIASQKQRKSLEEDIKVYQQKIAKLKDQMLGAKTNEQYRAFQNEISYAENQTREAEDQIIVHMEASEPLDTVVKASEVQFAQEKKVVVQEQEQARKTMEVNQAALKAILAERHQLATTIEARILAQYERAKKRWHTSGIADATAGRCDACHISLRPQFFQELKQGGLVMTCESCGRILYYNPPVSMEHELHQKV
ncbi:MAG: hypothetical protein H7039_21885 [Bryobacteraceae bacterium]|nr:hypothetical protein [Bryobacteraceae bacterium]